MNCIRCLNGFYLSNSLCVRLPTGCLAVNSNGTCITCDNNYIALNSGCFSAVINCQNYDVGGKCTACLLGYTLLRNQTCKINPQLCLRMNIDTFKCDECIRGFVPIDFNSYCAMNVSNCISYNADGSCR